MEDILLKLLRDLDILLKLLQDMDILPNLLLLSRPASRIKLNLQSLEGDLNRMTRQLLMVLDSQAKGLKTKL